MAWVKFKRRYSWRVPGNGVSFLTFKADRAYSVKPQCAEDAIADGAAVPHGTPRKGEGAADGAGAAGS